MTKHLKGLSIYVIGGKLFNRPLRGYDGQTESDMTRLRRGIRSNHNLNWHEAFYRALDEARLLDAFQMKFPDIADLNLVQGCKISEADALERARSCKTWANRAGISKEDRDHNLRNMDENEVRAEAYRFLQQVEADAERILDSLVKKRDKLIPWKDLQSVAYYEYDAATNSLVEIKDNGDRV